MNSLPQEQITQQINDSVSSLTNLMEKNPDLIQDVLPFMQGTFAKLQQLVGYKLSFEQSYEVLQIATNYLPKALHSYCGLPIEYRNKKLIKGDKTARDLLIGDLKILKKQVYEFENNLFAELEQSMRVNSTVIKEKFSSQMELATQVESAKDDNFINQFDIEKFNSNDSYSSLFIKNNTEPKALTQAISGVVNTGNGIHKVAKNCFSGLKNTYINHSTSLKNMIGNIALVLVIVSVPASIYFGCSYLNRENSLNNDSIKHTTSMYHIMENSLLAATQITDLSQKDYKDLIGSSFFRKSMVSYQTNGSNITISLKDIDSKYCKDMVDSYTVNFNESSMTINNIVLPEQHVISDKYYFSNNNHKLCYLDNNNINITLDSAKIYKNHTLQVQHDSGWLAAKQAVINKDKAEIETLVTIHKNSKSLWQYENLLSELTAYEMKISK